MKLKIDLPTNDERLGILKLHLKSKKHSITQDLLSNIANETSKYSGADLEAILNEAAYSAVSSKRQIVND